MESDMLLKSLAEESIIDDILVAGLSSFDDLLRVVQQFPYGRNTTRNNPELVWTEQRGTCSSKHAFLKKVADEQDFTNVKLVLAIYKMNPKNTPGIKTVLEKSPFAYIPEAHCYLMIDGKRIDVTFPYSNIEKLLSDVIEENFIEWSDVATHKVERHKEFIKIWLLENQYKNTLDEVWALREACLKALSE